MSQFKFFKPNPPKIKVKVHKPATSWEETKRSWIVAWVGKVEHHYYFAGLIKNASLKEAQAKAKIIRLRTKPIPIKGVEQKWRCVLEPTGV